MNQFFFSIFSFILSAAIIEIINKAVSTVTTTDSKNESICEELPDYSNLWEVENFQDDDFWFMKVGMYKIRNKVNFDLCFDR